MTAPSAREPQEAMAALERLYAKKVVTLEEAQAAAKLILNDPNAPFPPPRPEPAPAPAEAAPAAAEAPPAPAPAEAPAEPAEAAPARAPEAEGSSENGSSG